MSGRRSSQSRGGRLRIVAGAARGRHLKVPVGGKVRPTPDRVREALFSILGDRCLDARVLDPCAGTGALGLEALSRGANEVVLIELNRRVAETLKGNIERVGLSGAHLEVGDARTILTRLKSQDVAPFDLALIDPPFHLNLAVVLAAHLLDLGLLAPKGLVVLEHPVNEPLGNIPEKLRRVDQRHYGTVALDLFEHDTIGSKKEGLRQ